MEFRNPHGFRQVSSRTIQDSASLSAIKANGCRTRFSPTALRNTPFGLPALQPHRPSQPNTILHSKPHLSPPTTTTHDARAPQTVRAPPDPVAALASVHHDVADPPLPHATHAFHVLVTWLPLRPPHWMVPRRPAWGEADEGGLGRDLVLGLLWWSVCGRCRICV